MSAMSLPAYDSLPQDQMITLAWFLSRWNMLFARSKQAGNHSGSLAGIFHEGSLRPSFCHVPCVSRLASSITYSPYSSHNSYQRVWLG